MSGSEDKVEERLRQHLAGRGVADINNLRALTHCRVAEAETRHDARAVIDPGKCTNCGWSVCAGLLPASARRSGWGYLGSRRTLRRLRAVRERLPAREEYRLRTLSPGDRADSTVVTTQARRSMHDWLFNETAEEYALSADWDDRWRTGGTLGEVIDEAHLSSRWILQGIERFVRGRDTHLAHIQAGIDAAR